MNQKEHIKADKLLLGYTDEDDDFLIYVHRLIDDLDAFKKFGARHRIINHLSSFLDWINLSIGKDAFDIALLHLLIDFDKVFGLDLDKIKKTRIPQEIEKLVELREKYRQQKNWQKADEIRQQVKKMGPIQDLLAMLPGLPTKALKSMKIDDHAFTKVEAIINSMTLEERRRPQIIDGSRRKRIARGSGSTVQDVNRLLNQYDTMRKMIKSMKRGGSRRSGLPLGWKN